MLRVPHLTGSRNLIQFRILVYDMICLIRYSQGGCHKCAMNKHKQKKFIIYDIQFIYINIGSRIQLRTMGPGKNPLISGLERHNRYLYSTRGLGFFW